MMIRFFQDSDVKRDRFVTGAYNGNHSGLDQCIAPSAQLQIDLRSQADPEGDKEPHSALPSLRVADLFADSLVVSSAAPQSPSFWAVVGSMILLSLFLLALLIIPLFYIDALPKREASTMLYVSTASATPNATRLPLPIFTAKGSSATLRIPRVVPATQELPSSPADDASGLDEGVFGSDDRPAGILGELRSTESAPALAKTPAATLKRIRVPEGISEANLVYDVAPKYPPEAGRARIEGTVVLLAVIGKDGVVQDVRVESGLSVLAQAAIEAVKQWRYRPYLLNGEPVEVDSKITINFTLAGK